MEGWRRFEAAVRLAVWVAVLAALWAADGQESPNQRAVLIGFLFADLVTWVLATLLELPSFDALAGAELALNLTVLAVIAEQVPLERPQGGEAEAVCFLVFMGTMSCKLGWLALKRVSDE